MAEEGEEKDREKRSKIEGSVLGQLLRPAQQSPAAPVLGSDLETANVDIFIF